jgi:hypothetical protein
VVVTGDVNDTDTAEDPLNDPDAVSPVPNVSALGVGAVIVVGVTDVTRP